MPIFMISQQDLALEFSSTHRNSLNLALHVVTCSIMYFACLSLLHGWEYTVVATYTGMMVFMIPFWYLVTTSLCMLGLAWISSQMELDTTVVVILFGIGYIGQDLAHYIVLEPTYQSLYYPQGSHRTWKVWVAYIGKLSLHTIYMLPLIFEACVRNRLFDQILALFLVQDRIVRVKLETLLEGEHLDAVRNWLDSQALQRNITSHWWYASLPSTVKYAFHQIANSQTVFDGFAKLFPRPEFSVKVIDSMNEVYVATVDTKEATSDNVFYSNHGILVLIIVDGPFLCFPFCSVYRAIVAVNENRCIQTVFPSHPAEKVLTSGDLWAFDFNREIHRIQMVEKPDTLRYNLKIHYIVYPTCFEFYGKVLKTLTSWYNTLARLAFLKTITPKSSLEKFLWSIIMLATNLFFTLIRSAGNTGAFNLVLSFGILSFVYPEFGSVFVALTSFIHYFIYIATFYHQQTYKEKIAYEGFKNTVVFYKAIAFIHLIRYYVADLTHDHILISLTSIFIGFGLSGAAALALGADGTYFGSELGVCDSKRVTSFPYNVLSHPMILGNILGLIGFWMAPALKQGYLIPLHIGFYTIHMLQEHFQIYRRHE